MTLSAGDGLKTIYIKPAFLLTIGAPVSASIILDTATPASQVVGPSGAFSQPDPIVNINVSVDDGNTARLRRRAE